MSVHVSQIKPSSTFFSTNYFRVSEKIFKIKMGRCEKACLIFLFKYQNFENTYPSAPTISEAMEWDLRAVYEALKNLEKDTTEPHNQERKSRSKKNPIFKKPLPPHLPFIKTIKNSGISNTYEILYDNIEIAYQNALLEEKNNPTENPRRCKPVLKMSPVVNLSLVRSTGEKTTTTSGFFTSRVVDNSPLPPVVKKPPYNKDSITTYYNDDDDKAQSAEIPPSSHQKEMVQQPTAEQPVIKEKKPTSEQINAASRIQKLLPKNEYDKKDPFFNNKWIAESNLELALILEAISYKEERGELFDLKIQNSITQFESAVQSVLKRKYEKKTLEEEYVSIPEVDREKLLQKLRGSLYATN